MYAKKVVCPKITDEGEDVGGILEGCCTSYLSQKKVTIHRRYNGGEDGPGNITEINLYTGEVKDKKAYEDELYGRRSAIFIDFECEECDEVHKMIIQQHKGRTIIGWVDQ